MSRDIDRNISTGSGHWTRTEGLSGQTCYHHTNNMFSHHYRTSDISNCTVPLLLLLYFLFSDETLSFLRLFLHCELAMDVLILKDQPQHQDWN